MSKRKPLPTVPDQHPGRAGALGENRPVRRKSRTFRPNYIAMAPSYQCKHSFT